jgi:hypothetical protein
MRKPPDGLDRENRTHPVVQDGSPMNSLVPIMKHARLGESAAKEYSASSREPAAIR